MCKAENVIPRKGDILFVRTGMIPEWDTFTEEQKKAYAAQEEAEHAGVEASIDLLEWLWDTGITAVAGDAISWEVSNSSWLAFSRVCGCHGLISTS
jgi:kynurenine formamidase